MTHASRLLSPPTPQRHRIRNTCPAPAGGLRTQRTTSPATHHHGPQDFESIAGRYRMVQYRHHPHPLPRGCRARLAAAAAAERRSLHHRRRRDLRRGARPGAAPDVTEIRTASTATLTLRDPSNGREIPRETHHSEANGLDYAFVATSAARPATRPAADPVRDGMTSVVFAGIHLYPNPCGYCENSTLFFSTAAMRIIHTRAET